MSTRSDAYHRGRQSALRWVHVSVGTFIAVLFIVEQSLNTYCLCYNIVVRTYHVTICTGLNAEVLTIWLCGLVLYFVVDSIEIRINLHLFSKDV